MDVNFQGYSCVIDFQFYGANDNNAIQLLGAKGTNYAGKRIAVATVYTDIQLSSNVVAIKGWSENEGMEKALIEANVIKSQPAGLITLGYVEAKIYELTPAAIIFKNLGGNVNGKN